MLERFISKSSFSFFGDVIYFCKSFWSLFLEWLSFMSKLLSDIFLIKLPFFSWLFIFFDGRLFWLIILVSGFNFNSILFFVSGLFILLIIFILLFGFDILLDLFGELETFINLIL